MRFSAAVAVAAATTPVLGKGRLGYAIGVRNGGKSQLPSRWEMHATSNTSSLRAHRLMLNTFEPTRPLIKAPTKLEGHHVTCPVPSYRLLKLPVYKLS